MVRRRAVAARCWGTGAAAVLAAALALVHPVSAQDGHLQTVDAHADTPGAIAVDTNGWGYLAWDRPTSSAAADAVLFCRIPPGGACLHPLRLPLPDGSSSEGGIVQPFVVLGSAAGVVYVIGPRYILDDTVIWKSTNDGQTFTTQVSTSATDQTAVGDVIRSGSAGGSGDAFSIVSSNVGLGYTYTGWETHTYGVYSYHWKDFLFGPGDVLGSTLALGDGDLVAAYWTENSPEVHYFWTPVSNAGGAALWSGPHPVGDGADARLASGPSGLYLLAEHVYGNGSARIEVRKWSPSAHSFGPATVVSADSPAAASTDPGGIAVNPTTGAVDVAWPGTDAAGDEVMRLWTSTDGGQTFSGPLDVAPIAGSYGGPASLAVTGAHGFLTFLDTNGLELVDLWPVEQSTSSHP